MPTRNVLRSFHARVPIAFAVVLAIIFYMTAWLLSSTVPMKQPGEEIYQEFAGTPVAELLASGMVNWRKRQFGISFRQFVSTFQRSRPGHRERALSAAMLAASYHLGNGTERDFDRALYYARVDELKNNASALYRAGIILKDPRNHQGDADRARNFLRLAAQKGFAPARAELKKITN